LNGWCLALNGVSTLSRRSHGPAFQGCSSLPHFLLVDCKTRPNYRLAKDPAQNVMLTREFTPIELLPFLLQLGLGNFQETIRYYVSKYRDNLVVAVAYSVGCFAVLVIIYMLVASSKKR